MRSDSQLLEAAKADPGAFRELYERHAARIHAFHSLGTTPGAARVSVHRGLTTLRNRLTDRQEATP